MNIIGAGMAGLLAANMLARYKPIIVEQQSILPHNHHAVLRFRNPTVGDVLGIPFKPVQLIKATAQWRNPVADALAYADKNTGQLRSDRSIAVNRSEDMTRYIAPPDLIERMARDATIEFGESAQLPYPQLPPTISTIPMPMLMQVLDYPQQDQFRFSHQPGVTLQAHIKACEAYVSIQVPQPDLPFSRIAITGDLLTVEGHANMTLDALPLALDLLGIKHDRIINPQSFPQQYFKINPLDDDDARKRFIAWATDEYNIYALGRYATWRPGLQLEALVNDIRLIERWIGNRYELQRHRVR